MHPVTFGHRSMLAAAAVVAVFLATPAAAKPRPTPACLARFLAAQPADVGGERAERGPGHGGDRGIGRHREYRLRQRLDATEADPQGMEVPDPVATLRRPAPRGPDCHR